MDYLTYQQERAKLPKINDEIERQKATHRLELKYLAGLTAAHEEILKNLENKIKNEEFSS